MAVEEARRAAGYARAEWLALTWVERTEEVAWYRMRQTMLTWENFVNRPRSGRG